jgi:hypothetical protein
VYERYQESIREKEAAWEEELSGLMANSTSIKEEKEEEEEE